MLEVRVLMIHLQGYTDFVDVALNTTKFLGTKMNCILIRCDKIEKHFRFLF